jgi:hypothetical protein
VSLDRANLSSALDTIARAPLRRSTAAVLKSVMLSGVVPALVAKHGILPEQCRVSPMSNRASELADLLIGSDQSAAVELLEEMQHADGLMLPQNASLLFEPAARKLGDLWSEDLCSEFDVTLGLVRLQTAIRSLRTGTRAPIASSCRLQRPMVLIAPEPGELHQLGAALDADVLRNAGWTPHCDYPANLQALQDRLSVTWFDALDLSLSCAFRRDHRLPGLNRTIAYARRASLNPALFVMVGGRTFLEDETAGAQVGADFATRTAVNVDRAIVLGLDAAKASSARLN